MDPVARHAHTPDLSFDGGNLDCGGGLLLLIRRHIDPLERGGLLEILSTDSTVKVELPAWCRLTSNELVSWTRVGGQRSFLVCKGTLAERAPGPRTVARRPQRGAPPRQGHRARNAPAPSARARHRAPLRHGRWQLAPSPLDAPGRPRAS